jgi:hypothetical protein
MVWRYILLLSACCSDTILCWLTNTGNKIRYSIIESKKFKSFCSKHNYCSFNSLVAASNQGHPAYSRGLSSSIVPSTTQKMFSNDGQIEEDPRFFFNREWEINALRTILNGPPRLTVMLGPPSTGKTRLLNRVISSLNVDGSPEYHAININLRGAALTSGKQFWEYVESTSSCFSCRSGMEIIC